MTAPRPIRRPRATASAGGFTLIELLTTIAIAAVLLGIAAPSFITFQKNSQLTSTANTFVAALSAARAEAMKRQLNAFVMPGNGSQTDWAQGWTVFVDGNWDFAPGDPSDITITSQGPIPSAVTIGLNGLTGASGTSGTGGGYVMFNGAGFVQTTAGGPPPNSASLVLQFSNGTEQRNVLISPAGRIRVCKPDTTNTTCNPSNPF